jgi:hypothetical protein
MLDLDICNPNFNPQQCLENYIQFLCDHDLMCYTRFGPDNTSKKVLYTTPHIRFNQLYSWVGTEREPWIAKWYICRVLRRSPEERTKQTKQLIYIWQLAGWIPETEDEHNVYNFTTKGNKIINKVLNMINQTSEDTPNKAQPHL